MNARELLGFLCDDPTHDAATIIDRWITDSRRFHDFVSSNRSKIRKKLRTATTPESLRSVLLELEVARRFVLDSRCAVEYERHGQGRVRGSDLTVTFRARTTVDLEVTHMRSPEDDPIRREGKLIAVVCYKLGQMSADGANVLVLAAEAGQISVEDVALAMKRLKDRIERRDDELLELLKRYALGDPSRFFRQFQRLNGIVVWNGPDRETGSGAALWTNPQARRPLPAAIASLLGTAEPPPRPSR